MEKVLDTILFDAPELAQKKWLIDGEYVARMLDEIAKDDDISRYIL
jgi:ATP-dependent HslUV protease ATP-binding subunit HslU